jgi:diguanylate cyclase (GGDEF)-like protein
VPLPVIFSLIFFTAFAIYFFFGIYAFSLNINSRMNRVFLYCCLALCIWAFSFSISNSAPDYATSLFWRRIAAIGWGSFYSFILHVIFLLTGKMRRFKRKWIYFLIYFPAVFNIFVFCLYGDIAVKQYQLIYMPTGWVNTAASSVWDRLYQLYYIGFSIASITLLWHWGKTSIEQSNKDQTNLIIASYAVALITGTLTEYVINLYTSYYIPQLAPVIVLIPISVIFYCIKKYGLLKIEQKSSVVEGNQILSEVTRVKVYEYIILAIILGAFLYFATQYLIYRAPLKSILEFSFFILLTALYIFTIQRLNLKATIKELLINIVLAAMIPVILLILFINTAATTVWSIAFILVILSIAFSNKRMLIVVGSTTLCTLLLVWIINPEQPMIIQSTDHFSRIVIFAIVLWIAFYINRVFLQRLAEKEEQVELQKLLSTISTNFAITNENNVNEKVTEVINLIGMHFKIDRINLVFFSSNENFQNRIFEWCNAGIESIQDCLSKLNPRTLPLGVEIDQKLSNGMVFIPKIDALPDTSSDKKWLAEKLIKSLLILPLVNQGKIMGFLSFDSIKEEKVWSIENQEILKVLANHISDIWLKVEAERKINYMAYYDILTGLPNRTLLEERMQNAISLAIRTEKVIFVAFIDIDNFKSINDSMGHDSGDALLVEIGKKLSTCVRQHDTVSRFGGDEFIVMITQISQFADIKKVADKIMGTFQEPLKIKNQEFFITFSMGIAAFPVDGATSKELIKNADLAMYTSKEKGKNQYTLCSQEIKKEFFVNMELSNRLYRALERDELALDYQPKVIPSTEEMIAVEALIRWHHPQKGVIPPNQFIPMAEKNGLITPIGNWVLQTACRQQKIWQKMGYRSLRMAVNLSLGQFRNKTLVRDLASILQETGLDPSCLELEITESIAINEPENINKTLNELKELGISISIDDFGTQYSSLSRLKNLPIDRIKIDMHFIHGISVDSKQEGIIKAIMQLAKTLDLKVTAEGVETEQQLAFLQEILCDEIQGFYYYKPMPAAELESILKRIALFSENRIDLLQRSK